MKHIPQRMCVACRKMYPQNELIRLVRDNKTGEIKFDCDKKLFGRGAYICKNIDCIRNAEKKRGIERHFKCAVPKELYKAAEELNLNNKFLGMLGLAKRAGKVQTGEDICSKAVKSGVSKLIIVACDASDNTKKSITDSCKFYKTKFVEAGSKAELGKFTGADSRAVVSVNDDNFAKAIFR